MEAFLLNFVYINHNVGLVRLELVLNQSDAVDYETIFC